VDKPKTILTIAGFDPSSGAGVTADLAVIAAHGHFGISAITALTVQSTLGVKSVEPVAPALLEETLNYLVADLPPDGIKIGMLASEENVRVVAKFLLQFQREYGGTTIPVVLDPVIRSSSGRELLSAAGIESMKKELLHLVSWVTPNTMELSILDERPVTNAEEMEVAAISLTQEWVDLAVAATGGHLDEGADDILDIIIETHGKAGEWQRGARIESRATHGTGCAYSTALLCGLVSDVYHFDAARAAKEYVAEAMRSAQPIGQGNGPMNLFWPIRR
jgi:hydroxymethylpyrimidine/phosphomethylpyrimidine kinase